MDASRWGTRGESAARLLKKGSRVSVTGELYERTWQDEESGEDRRTLRIRADHVDLDLNRLDRVTMLSRSDDPE